MTRNIPGKYVGWSGSKDLTGSFKPGVRSVLLLLAFYFGLQVASRTIFSSSVDLDEAEAVVLAQSFSFGYGPEPPLYTWLQRAFFGLAGESVFSLSLLKNGLLFCNYLLLFMTARLVTRSEMAAVTACLSLFFLPTIAWESQRDLTHSVLSCTCSIATLLALLQAHKTRCTAWYIVLGVCAGLGLISKYNYALWPVGLLVAGLSLRDFRAVILDPRIFLSVVVAICLFIPNAIWLGENRDLALLTSSKFEINAGLPWHITAGRGIKNLMQSILAFAGPISAIYAAVFFKAKPSGLPEPNGIYQRLIPRAWTCIGFILVLAVFVGRITGIKER